MKFVSSLPVFVHSVHTKEQLRNSEIIKHRQFEQSTVPRTWVNMSFTFYSLLRAVMVDYRSVSVSEWEFLSLGGIQEQVILFAPLSDVGDGLLICHDSVIVLDKC